MYLNINSFPHIPFRLNILFLVLWLASSLSLFSQDYSETTRSERPIRVKGDHFYPPYEFINEKGEPDGFNVELFKALARELNLEFQLELGPWDEVRAEIEEGTIDVITGMMVSPARANKVLFGLPHSFMDHGIFVHKKSEIRNPEDLHNKAIIVQKGDLMHDYLIETELTLDIIAVENQLAALRLIDANQYDAALIGTFQGLHLIKEYNLKNIAQFDLGTEPQKYAIAVSRNREDLLPLLNMGIYQLKAKGEYDRLYEKWFAIYESNFLLNKYKYHIVAFLAFVFTLISFIILLRLKVKKATKNLRASERKFRKFAENADDLIYRYEFYPVRGFTYVSPSATKITGYTPGEHYADPDFGYKVIHPDDAPVLENLTTKPDQFFKPLLMRWIKKSGEVIWMEQKNIPVYDNEGRLIAIEGISRDITERKKYEEELLQNETRLRSLVGILQNRSDSTQEFLDYALNESIKLSGSKYGYIYFYDEDKKQFILNTWSKDVMQECSIRDPQSCYELDKTGFWGEAVRQRRPIIENDFHAANPLKKGYPEGHVALKRFMTIPLINNERIVAVIGVANKETDYKKIDILQLTLLMDAVWKVVEHRKSEEEVSKRERLLQKIFDLIPIGLWITDKSGKLIKGNPAGIKIWGAEPTVGPEDYGVFKARRLPSGETIKDDEWALGYTIRDGVTIKDELIEIEAFDGVKRIILNYTSPIIDDNGNIDGAIVVNNDITTLTKVENDLRESEERYKLAMQATKDGIFERDMKTNKVYYSPGWKNMLGYNDDEIKNEFSEWERLVNPDDKERVLGHLNDCTQGKKDSFETEFQMLHKNNYWVDILVRGIVIFDETGNPLRVVGTHVDITEQKKSKQALEDSEKRYRIITENIEDVVWQLNTDLRFTYVSPAVKAILGYTVEEAKKITATDLLDPEGLALLKQVIANKISGKSPDEAATHEYLMRHKSGHFVMVEVKSNPIFDETGQLNGFVGITRDITLRKKTEEFILKLSAGMEQSPASVIITDTDGNIEYVNRKFLEITGYSKEELTGKMLRILKPGGINENKHKEIWNKLNAGLEWSGEYLNRKKNNQTYWESILISPIKSHTGNPKNFIVISEDITERKQMEAELVDARDKAEESDRLKTAFLNNLSHEIRTPLNAIIGFTGFLTDPELPGDKRIHFSEIIQRSSSQLLSIITDIISISILESGKAKAYETDTDLERLFDIIYEQHILGFNSKGIDFIKKLSLSKPEQLIITDETKLIQILSNLIGNALKFTEKGKVEFGCSRVNGELKFYVKDTGIGIPPKFHEKIFERFRQVDLSDSREHGGNGLGLSIAKSYAELLGGKMWINSEPGKGSTFYFTLPHKPLTFREDALFEDPTKLGQVKKTILVAEDDEINFILTKEILVNHGVTVIHANHGAEAVNYCKERPEIELVLMDIKMPVMDGFEATRQIKEMRPELPVIALTAYALSGDREIALAQGCDDYITKPLKRNKLLEMINKYLEK